MLKVGNRQIVSRALMQSVSYCFFENDIPLFQVSNCCVAHDISPIWQGRQRDRRRGQGSMGCLNLPQPLGSSVSMRVGSLYAASDQLNHDLRRRLVSEDRIKLMRHWAPA